MLAAAAMLLGGSTIAGAAAVDIPFAFEGGVEAPAPELPILTPFAPQVSLAADAASLPLFGGARAGVSVGPRGVSVGTFVGPPAPVSTTSTQGAAVHADPKASAADVAIPVAAAAAAVLVASEPFRWGLLTFFAPLYSRIRRDDLLANGGRAKVFGAVQSDPGVALQDVVQRTGLGWGTVVYHLDRLEKERMVVSRRHGMHRRFFVNGSNTGEHEAISVLHHDTSRNIASFLLTKPGAAQKDVCAALGLAPSLAHKYLERLSAASLVSKEREWRTVRYFPSDKLGGLLGKTGADPLPTEPGPEPVAGSVEVPSAAVGSSGAPVAA
ncbi:MAG: winged helix-turn-helix transcriptional regulator [Methanobacteriota archaeon]